MVLAQLEDYGFCKKGEGGPFVASGALRMDGLLPTNTSGGQLSEAHCEGMLQVVEVARQMRHTYPPQRQVAGAEVALVSGHGGNRLSLTKAPERWDASWDNNVKAAQLADEAGLEFLLPIGRWHGYQGRATPRAPRSKPSPGPAGCSPRPATSRRSARSTSPSSIRCSPPSRW